MNLVFSTGFLVPQMLGGGQDYFHNAPAKYPNALFATVPILGQIPDRAKALASQIVQKFPAGRVHLVAHSMGGLDSRFLISHDVQGLASSGRIASLSTISTPHLGSAVADFINAPPDLLNLPARILYETITAAVEAMGMPVGALANLTTTYCATFNAQNPDRDDVRYFCYAGVGLYNFFLKPTHTYLQYLGRTPDEVQNDGIVTLASAKHIPLTEPPWAADHISEVGWQIDRPGFKSDFDHLAAIDRIVQRLNALPG